MRLLIVHRDAEIGETLRSMASDYTTHAADYAASEHAALAWVEQHAGCDLLITQLESENVDGFALAASLGKKFPWQETFFLPNHPLAAQRLQVATTRIFPEPIDGE